MSDKFGFQQLVDMCKQTHQEMQRRASRSVDAYLVARNWLFGGYIVEARGISETAPRISELMISETGTMFRGGTLRSMKIGCFWAADHSMFRPWECGSSLPPFSLRRQTSLAAQGGTEVPHSMLASRPVLIFRTGAMSGWDTTKHENRFGEASLPRTDRSLGGRDGSPSRPFFGTVSRKSLPQSKEALIEYSEPAKRGQEYKQIRPTASDESLLSISPDIVDQLPQRLPLGWFHYSTLLTRTLPATQRFSNYETRERTRKRKAELWLLTFVCLVCFVVNHLVFNSGSRWIRY